MLCELIDMNSLKIRYMATQSNITPHLLFCVDLVQIIQGSQSSTLQSNHAGSDITRFVQIYVRRG